MTPRHWVVRSTFALLSLAALGAPLRAQSSVGFGQWYEFRFFAPGTFAIACDVETCFPGANSVFARRPPWTFTSTTDVLVLLTDAFPAGDSFSLFDFGSLVGSTPVVSEGAGCGSDPDPCFADPRMSHRRFALAAGPHSLTIRVDVSPFGTGSAYFQVQQVQVVPEPATVLLVGAGLFTLGGLARARRCRRGARAG